MTLLGEMSAKDSSTKKTRYDYCAAIRHKPVSKLTTEDALGVLKPLWQTRSETANRLRGRCERVWDFAKARGHCSGENPFRWRGHLDKLLPKRPLLTRGHHKAMPFADVPAFIGRLRAMQGGCGPSVGICDPDGCAFRRGAWRPVGGDRLSDQAMDGASRAHEGRP